MVYRKSYFIQRKENSHTLWKGMEIAVAVIKSSMDGSSKTITMLNKYVTDINFS